jgi:hypothetical protein
VYNCCSIGEGVTTYNAARAQQDWNEAIRTLFEGPERIRQQGMSSWALYDEWVTARQKFWIARERLRAFKQGQEG